MNKTLSFTLLGLAGAAIMLVSGCGEEPAPKPTPAAIAAPASLPTAVPVEWTTYSDNDLHFSFDSPITLEVNKPPTGLSTKVVAMEGHSASEDIFINVQAVELNKGYEPDLAPEIEKQINLLKDMREALRNLQVATNPIDIGGASGLLAEGTASMPGKIPWEMKLLKVRKDTTLLDMFIQYSPTEEGKAVTDRVVHSLSFSN